MKTVAIIPIKKRSTRVPNKNFRIVNKKPLYAYLLEKIKKCNFDEIFVDSDSSEIERYCEQNKINFICRLPHLALDNASGNDLLNYHAKIIEADIYFQPYITAPLLKIKTINECIKILKTKRKFDSILTSKKIFSWFWFNNKPVNYDPKKLPRSQDAKPMVVETTGLYGIRSESLKKRKSRIGNKPYFYQVSEEESLDLDDEKDFEYLEYYVKKYLSRPKR